MSFTEIEHAGGTPILPTGWVAITSSDMSVQHIDLRFWADVFERHRTVLPVCEIEHAPRRQAWVRLFIAPWLASVPSVLHTWAPDDRESMFDCMLTEVGLDVLEATHTLGGFAAMNHLVWDLIEKILEHLQRRHAMIVLNRRRPL